MAHEVENMFSVRETPWHGLGHIVQEAPTAKEAIELAGLDWTVSQQPIYRNVKGEVREIESHRAIVRDSDHSILGVLGEAYTPLQNSEAFTFFDPFINSGLASFETAGSLREGRTVWILAKLNKTPLEVGKGDEVNKFLLLSNGHDGNMAVRVGFTPIRVVCANTLAISHSEKTSQLIRIMHSKRVNINLQKIRDIINAADARFEATAEQYRYLASAKVKKADIEKYVEIVFGYSAVEVERRAMAKERITSDIQRLFETGRGAELNSAKGTQWGLYNAVTEYLSYERGRSQDVRLANLWFGQSAQISKKALSTSLEMARVA